MDTRPDQRGHQIQRVLLSVGEANRLRRSHPRTGTGEAASTERSYAAHPSSEGHDRTTVSAVPDIERPFELGTTRRGGHVYLAIVGDLDATSSVAFTEAIEALVGGGTRSIVVDLARATIVEGPGLSALDEARGLMEARHGEFVLKAPHSDTLALLARKGQAGTFTII